jgi:hypothetical protein
MLNVTAVNANGQLDVKKGIVADRIRIGSGERGWWEFE